MHQSHSYHVHELSTFHRASSATLEYLLASNRQGANCAGMEQQVLSLLQATTVPDTETIRKAERSLVSLYRQQDYPFALLNISTHANIESGCRKAALTALRKYVEATWSPNFEEASSQQSPLSEDARKQVRSQILAICTSSDGSNEINQNLAGESSCLKSLLGLSSHGEAPSLKLLQTDRIFSNCSLKNCIRRLPRQLA